MNLHVVTDLDNGVEDNETKESALMESLGDSTPPDDEAATLTATVVPPVAIRWAVAHATTSNVELARLSNVHPSWRRLVQQALLDLAQSQEPPPVASLLLPSMLAQWLRDPGGSDGPTTEETYCVAWFAPEGIQALKLDDNDGGAGDEATVGDHERLQHAVDSAIHSAGTGSVPSQTTTTTTGNGPADHPSLRLAARASILPLEPFAPSGHTSYQPNDDDKEDRRSHRSARRSANRGSTNRPGASATHSFRSRSPQPSSDSACYVCPEWSGYQSPWQVLRPFGYSKRFLNDLLAAASTCASRNEEPPQPGQPTFAVRGATLARPEGYCCCMDLGHSRHPSSWMSQRRELQRDVLPRVLRMPPPTPDSPRPRTAVQFLNSSGSHAVCMVTPPFTQPLREPLTILLVGIATEDGCFVSGLQHRMEVGHLYPRTPDIDWSGVCLAAAAWHPAAAAAPSPALPYRFSSDDDDGDDESSHEYDGGDREEGSSKARSNAYSSLNSLKCRCQFAAVPSKFDRSDGEWDDDTDDDDHDTDLEPLETCRIHRGRTGPGQWRCYTAVFDGPHRSEIRVDGIPETFSLQSPSLDHRRRRQSQLQLEPMLDGLTIGSDHCFGMSLCCGYGSGGEGEGAIAELVVFKGHLNELDLRVLENDLMQRHDIPIPIQRPEERDRESEWIRQSHALYAQSCSSSEQETNTVPLRIMAKHPTVAWYQVHPVSGEQVRLPRIGVRSTQAGSSSDW